jgi:Arc/MetJ-type ribon-helix-helix transcriptional regulator
MRTTKVMSFSVPPEFEDQILVAAKSEHRTVSEFLREAVRQYITKQKFEETRQAVSARLKKKGLKETDVEDIVNELRGG